MNQKYTLYYYATCPFCVRVRMALKRMRIKIPLKNIRENKLYEKELIAGGGKRQVPCLRINENGSIKWLYESADIVRYFREKYA